MKSYKEDAMKVLALNSSPRSDAESYTFTMLHHLVDGMREAGAAVEVVNLHEKKIRNCIGCFTCWTKTPGQCIHNGRLFGTDAAGGSPVLRGG